MASKGHYSQADVNKIFKHISIKTVRDWGLRHLYGWVDEYADKRGTHRKYGLFNLYQIGVVEELSAFKVPITKIREVMDKHFKEGKKSRPKTHTDMPVMEKMLIIYKPEELKATSKERRPEDLWVNILVNKEELANVVRREDFYGMIVINLPKIKRHVDGLVLAAR